VITIRIKKMTDGSAALSCVRADGSVTWQRQEGRQGRFFPFHDLTHVAVETVLPLRGFYRIVAEGWELTDFGKPWPKGPLPEEAHLAEVIVGFLDTERGAGIQWSPADWKDAATSYFRQRKLVLPTLPTETELQRIRQERSRLFALWTALPAGETLELKLEAGPLPSV
jgi:hypothetical protein